MSYAHICLLVVWFVVLVGNVVMKKIALSKLYILYSVAIGLVMTVYLLPL